VNRRPTAALVLAAVMAATLVTTTGCSDSTDSTVAVSAGPTASAAPTSGAELGAADFAAALKRSGTTIVDVRTPQEYAQGHLPGAVNLDVSSPDFAARIAALDPSAPYAVYCRSGNRSGVALEAMAEQGFTAAYHLGGGIGAWQEAGGEVVTG
jgi:phage shock protein E